MITRTNMIQQTSKQAYDKIISELGNRQYEVFTLLREIEPVCNKEISKKLNMPINEITPRIKELRYKGVVEEAYKAEYDGRKVIFWTTTAPDQFKKNIKQDAFSDMFNESIEQFDKLVESIKPKEESHAVSWLEPGEKL